MIKAEQVSIMIEFLKSLDCCSERGTQLRYLKEKMAVCYFSAMKILSKSMPKQNPMMSSIFIAELVIDKTSWSKCSFYSFNSRCCISLMMLVKHVNE